MQNETNNVMQEDISWAEGINNYTAYTQCPSSCIWRKIVDSIIYDIVVRSDLSMISTLKLCRISSTRNIWAVQSIGIKKKELSYGTCTGCTTISKTMYVPPLV